MNESYAPQPGEAVLVTLRMTAFEQRGLGFECDSTAGPVIMYANEPAVVSEATADEIRRAAGI